MADGIWVSTIKNMSNFINLYALSYGKNSQEMSIIS